jgi:hypothetical protein
VSTTESYGHVELESIELKKLVDGLARARGIDVMRGRTDYVKVTIGDRTIELWRADVQRFVDEKKGWS